MATTVVGDQAISPFPYAVTLTVQRRTRDRFGDWSDTTTHTIPGCALSPQNNGENVSAGRRDTVTTAMLVHAPFGSDVRPSDTVSLEDGTVWEVDGDTTSYSSPFTGWAPGMRFLITRTTG